MSKEEQEKEEKNFAKKLSESIKKPNIIDVKMDPEGTDAKVKNT